MSETQVVQLVQPATSRSLLHVVVSSTNPVKVRRTRSQRAISISVDIAPVPRLKPLDARSCGHFQRVILTSSQSLFHRVFLINRWATMRPSWVL
jgi:hypothetical protein